MSGSKRILQVATLFALGWIAHGAVHSTSAPQVVLANKAGVEDTIIRPLPWVSKSQARAFSPPIPRSVMNVSPQNAIPKAPPFVPLNPMAPKVVAAAAKVEEKKKKTPKPSSIAKNAPQFFNPSPTPTTPASSPAPAAAPAGGSLVNGPVKTTTQQTAAAGGGKGGVSQGLSAKQVVSELFPNGFTQTGMATLSSYRQQRKITTAVYYEVLGQAANSSSSQSQTLAVTALVAAPGAEAFTILAGMTEHSTDSAVTTQVTSALAQYQTTQMMAYLSTPLESSDSAIRFQALVQLTAGAQIVMTQLSSIQTSSGPTRTTASESVQTFFNGYLVQLQQLIKTETNAQNHQEETNAIAIVSALVQSAKSVQAQALAGR